MRNKVLDFIYKLFTNDESGIKVIGNNWFARYSNAFQDREKEFFPVEAIDRYIERVDTGVVPSPELWVWHTPIVIGKAKTIARIDKFVVAAGTFGDDAVSQAAKGYLSQHKAKLSHGFIFDKDKFKDGAYWDYNTFEISILPFGKGVEANAYTNFEVKDMKISDEKRKFFAEMFGKETAEALIANTEKASKALEDAGVQFKDFTHVGNLKRKTKAEGDEEDDDEEETPAAEGQADEGETPAEDDEEEEQKKKKSDSSWKALVVDVVNDTSEIAEGQLKLAKEINGLRTALDAAKKEYSDKIAALKAENKALRDELALSPRGTRGSQADETEIEDKDLKQKLEEKQKGATDDFWNFAKESSKK